MKQIRTLLTLTFAVELFFSALVHAEPKSLDAPLKRPRIGLVLAGGGALGFAHVGVLKVLERERIPVDLVTGTSMGAIVGAAYASGVNLQEMEKLLSETDWDALFDESTPRADIPYRFKPGIGREIYGDVKIAFDDDGVVLPSGAVQGQNVLPLLQRMYDIAPSPVAFDDLPLPFRAVAADIETGQAYVPDRGDLSTIVRASMSVPGFFAPVEFDGKLLVDGGIANNLPIDIAQSMGADFLIVVELNADLKKRDSLGSPLAVAGQIVSLLLAQNSNLQHKLLRPSDIMIQPNLQGYSATDFPKGGEIMERGETAAQSFVQNLRKFAISEGDYNRYQQQRQTRALPEHQQIAYIRIENDSNLSDDSLLRTLGLKEGDDFTRSGIDEGVNKLYNMGQFASVRYSTEDLSNGKGITVSVQRKKWLDHYFRLGAAIEDDFDGNDSVRLGLSYRNTKISTPGSYLEVEGEIGKNPSVYSEFYQPWSSNSVYFVSPAVGIGRTSLFVSDDGDRVAEYQRSFGVVGVAVGRELGTSGEFRIGVDRGFGELEREVGDPALPEFSYDTGNALAAIEVDTLDKADFPTEGIGAQFGYLNSLEALGASDDFDQVSGRLALPYTFGRSTLLFNGDFGVTFSDRPVERSFSIGGFLDLSGFTQSSLAASDYGIGRILYYRRFSEVKTPLFGLDFFAGGSYEFATLQADPEALEDYDMINAGSIFFGIDTPLLPLYIGAGIADQDEFSIYLALGRIGARRR